MLYNYKKFNEAMTGEYNNAKSELDTYLRILKCSSIEEWKEKVKTLPKMTIEGKEYTLFCGGAHNKHYELGVTRDDQKFNGRVWKDEKYISFWKFPKTHEDLIKIAQDIENSYRICQGQELKIFEDKKNWFVEQSDSDIANQSDNSNIHVVEFDKYKNVTNESKIFESPDFPKGFFDSAPDNLDDLIKNKKAKVTLVDKDNKELNSWNVDDAFPFGYLDINEITFVKKFTDISKSKIGADEQENNSKTEQIIIDLFDKITNENFDETLNKISEILKDPITPVDMKDLKKYDEIKRLLSARCEDLKLDNIKKLSEILNETELLSIYVKKLDNVDANTDEANTIIDIMLEHKDKINNLTYSFQNKCTYEQMMKFINADAKFKPMFDAVYNDKVHTYASGLTKKLSETTNPEEQNKIIDFLIKNKHKLQEDYNKHLIYKLSDDIKLKALQNNLIDADVLLDATDENNKYYVSSKVMNYILDNKDKFLYKDGKLNESVIGSIGRTLTEMNDKIKFMEILYNADTITLRILENIIQKINIKEENIWKLLSHVKEEIPLDNSSINNILILLIEDKQKYFDQYIKGKNIKVGDEFVSALMDESHYEEIKKSVVSDKLKNCINKENIIKTLNYLYDDIMKDPDFKEETKTKLKTFLNK